MPSKHYTKAFSRLDHDKGVFWIKKVKFKYFDFDVQKTLSWKPVEGLLFFGLIMGWPSLTEVLKEEGVYDKLCSIDKDETLGMG